MVQDRNKTAKDLAWDRERTRLRKQVADAKHEAALWQQVCEDGADQYSAMVMQIMEQGRQIEELTRLHGVDPAEVRAHIARTKDIADFIKEGSHVRRPLAVAFNPIALPKYDPDAHIHGAKVAGKSAAFLRERFEEMRHILWDELATATNSSTKASAVPICGDGTPIIEHIEEPGRDSYSLTFSPHTGMPPIFNMETAEKRKESYE